MKKRDKTEEEMPRAVALPGHGAAEPGLRGAGPDLASGDVETYTEDLDEDEAAEVREHLRGLQQNLQQNLQQGEPGRITRD